MGVIALVEELWPLLQAYDPLANPDKVLSFGLVEQIIVGLGHAVLAPIEKEIDGGLGFGKVKDVAQVAMLIGALVGHKEGTDPSLIGRSHDKDIIGEHVADPLGKDALVAARAPDAPDDVVGHGEIVSGVVQIHAALEIERIVAHLVDQIVIVDIVAAGSPGFHGARVLAVQVHVVDIVIRDPVVARMDEIVPVFKGHTSHLLAQHLIAQALDRRPIARDMVYVVVQNLVVTALADVHTGPVADQLAAVMDVVVLHRMVMIHVVAAGGEPLQGHTVQAVTANQVTIEGHSLGIAVELDPAVGRVLDHTEAKGTVFQPRSIYGIGVGNADLQSLKVEVAHRVLGARSRDHDRVSRPGGDDGLFLDRAIGRPHIDLAPAAADATLARLGQQRERVLDDVAVVTAHLIALSAAHAQSMLLSIDLADRLVPGEPVVARPDIDIGVGQIPALGLKLTRSVDKGRLLATFDRPHDLKVALLGQPRNGHAVSVLKDLPWSGALRDVRLPNLTLVALPLCQTSATHQSRSLAGVRGPGDGILFRARVGRAKDQSFRQIVASPANEDAQVVLQPLADQLLHGGLGPLQRPQGTVGALAVWLGQLARPLIVPLKRHIEIRTCVRHQTPPPCTQIRTTSRQESPCGDQSRCPQERPPAKPAVHRSGPCCSSYEHKPAPPHSLG